MDLTIKEIGDALKNAPPFHKKSIEDSFVGRNITCELNYLSIYDYKTNHTVNCIDKDSNTIVSFDLSLEKYPEFKNLKKDNPIIVNGTIDHFDIVNSIIINEIKTIDFNPNHKTPNAKNEHSTSHLAVIPGNGKRSLNAKTTLNSWLNKKQKLLFAIIPIIAAVVGGGSYLFNINVINNKNNISSQNQVGGITAGGNVNVYQQNSDTNNFDISNLPSAFDFLEKTKKFNTSLEKENYIKTVSGTEVGDNGYVNDISGNGFSPNNYYVYIQKNKEISFSIGFIMCMTNEKNVKLAILKKESESLIKFKGQISGSSLDNCEFQ